MAQQIAAPRNTGKSYTVCKDKTKLPVSLCCTSGTTRSLVEVFSVLLLDHGVYETATVASSCMLCCTVRHSFLLMMYNLNNKEFFVYYTTLIALSYISSKIYECVTKLY